MHLIVQFFGAAVALAAICALAFSIAAAFNGDAGAALMAAAYGGSALLSGALLWCFGSIVGLLKAIHQQLVKGAS